MKKITKRKLALSSTTVQHLAAELGPEQLAEVAGGITLRTCTALCTDPCTDSCRNCTATC